jgi:hypothetical protein
MDLSGYQAFFDGKLTDYEMSDAEIAKAQACLKDLPKPPPLK